jgi:glycosyltransferase involved in cell wall biosynthesis
MKKKILFLCSIQSIHSQKWINYFKNSYDVTIISFDIEKKFFKENKNKIKFLIFNRFKNKYLNCIMSILYIFFRKIEINKYDVVHMHYIGLMTLIIFFFKTNKLILTIWGSDININFKNLFKKFFVINSLKQAQIITTDSHGIKKKLKNEKITNSGKIKIINFGVDVSFFKRQIIKPNKKNLTILSLRNHYPIYNNETILMTCDYLNKKNISFKCLIFGTGPSTPNYLDYIKKNNLDDKVFLLGRYDKKKIINIISSSQFYISTSLSDGGIAASTAEAMLLEVCCIISKNSDNSRWIKNGKNGFLVSNYDYKKIAEIIIKYKNKQKILVKMGKQAKETISKYNNYNLEMKKVDLIYKNI